MIKQDTACIIFMHYLVRDEWEAGCGYLTTQIILNGGGKAFQPYYNLSFGVGSSVLGNTC